MQQSEFFTFYQRGCKLGNLFFASLLRPYFFLGYVCVVAISYNWPFHNVAKARFLKLGARVS